MASSGIFHAIPVKRTWEVDFVKPLKSFIQETYGAGGNAEDHTAALNELNKLRNTIISKAGDRHESALEAIYRYYDQLTVIEGKFPISESQVRINFKWQDAFDKESLFGGKKTLSISSGVYEKACVLFNVAAIQSQVAEAQNMNSDESLKLAAKLFQQASGVLSYLKSLVPGIQSDLTPDLQPDTLNALSHLMLAQAQDCFVRKAMNDKMKPAVTSKLAMQCSDLYSEALKLLQLDSIRQLWPKDWINSTAGKHAGYHATTEFYQSQVAKEAKDFGEEIARLRRAKDLILSSEMRSGSQFIFQDLQRKIVKSLTEAEKDNDFIYHARIPDAATLTPVGKAVVAKSLPMTAPLSKQFKDLFEKIVPLAVHQSVVACENRRMLVVNSEIGRLRDATQLLNSVLASLNLPAAIEDLGGQEIPKSMSSKANEVKQFGGLSYLERLINELPLLLQRNKEILDESDRMLNEEEASDDQLKNQFRERWNRTPSTKLTESIRSEAAKYRTTINNAINADAIVRERFSKHRDGIMLLSQSDGDIQSSLPSSGPNSSLHNHPAVSELRSLLKKVEEFKLARDQLENEIKNANINDMANQFLSALLKDGVIDEESMSSERLQSVYGSLRERVAESIRGQDELLQKIQSANNEFSEAKVQNTSGVAREEKLKSLAAAYDSFIELKGNLEEGTKFYNDLTEILVRFQSKVTDFCFARKTEKDELMKDLSAGIARQTACPPPVAPAYQKPDESTKPEPPKRPPPPKFVPSAPPADTPIAAPRISVPPARPGQEPPPLAASNYPGHVPPYPTSFSTMPYPTYQAPMPNSYNPYFQQYPPQQGYPPQPYPQYNPPYQPQVQHPGYPPHQQYPGYQPR